MIEDHDDDDLTDIGWPPDPVCRDCGATLDPAPAGVYVDCYECGACELSRWPGDPYEPEGEELEAYHKAWDRATLASYVSPERLRAHLLATGWTAKEVFTLHRGALRPLAFVLRRADEAGPRPTLNDVAAASVPTLRAPSPGCAACGATEAWSKALPGAYVDCNECGACTLARWPEGPNAAAVVSFEVLCVGWEPLAGFLRGHLVASGWRGEVWYEQSWPQDGFATVPLDPSDPNWLNDVARVVELAARHEARTFEAVLADVTEAPAADGDAP